MKKTGGNGGYKHKTDHGCICSVGNPRTPKPTYKASGTSPRPTAKRAQDGTRANAKR